MALDKARVQLLDPKTGAVLAEVDVLTSAAVVSYTNDKATVKDFRGIPAGTSFKESDEVSVQEVLDKLIYSDEVPVIEYITDNNSTQITEDHTNLLETYETVRPFYLTSKINVGTAESLTITLKRYNQQTGQTISQESNVKVTPGSSYMYQREVDVITDNTKLQLMVTDGTNTINSPVISYEFTYPVFVGYCDLSEIVSDDSDELIDEAKAGNYFNTLIRNNSSLLEKRVVPISNLKGFSIQDVLYHNKKYHPCVLYPVTWNKIEAIVDANEDDITGSYIYNSLVAIKPNQDVTGDVRYTAYVSRREYYVQLAAAEKIEYRFKAGRGSLDHVEEGVPSLTGFDVLCKLPVDLRTLVDTYDDLLNIEYPYDGLVTFVKAEKSFFKYDQDTETWSPTNQQVFISITGQSPELSLGQWNDIVIDIKSGIFYQKYKNIRWEEKGRFVGGGTYVEDYVIGKTYAVGDIVYYNGKYYKATKETTSIPGEDDSWEETTIGGGTPGPVGPAGDAATIEIVEVRTGLPGSKALVENIGDKQNARLVFTIPQGPAGEDAVANLDKTFTKEGSAADAVATGEALKKKIDLPVDEEGNTIVPTKGQILYMGEDGLYWEEFNTLYDQAVKDYVERDRIAQAAAQAAAEAAKAVVQNASAAKMPSMMFEVTNRNNKEE